MLATIAVILLVLWGVGLFLHLFGGLIYIALVLAVLFGIAHWMKAKKTS
jgi:hypothetical protein